MSALTKIFVVLLVVMSLLLSAALIVFVNRQENFRVAAVDAKKQTTLATQKATALSEEILKVTGQKDQLATEMTNQVNTLKGEIASRDTNLAQLQGQLAEKDQTITQLTAANTSSSQALAAAQADIKARQEAFNTLFAEKDNIQKQKVENENRITELTNALDITKRQDKYVTEQIAQLQQQNAQLNDILRKYNISPTGNQLPAGGAINATPAVNINGIVRDFKNINGVPFATISLGSADAVTHGMKFNVIDPTKNQWLGYLTVDNVGVHEATGRLDGPHVNDVRANVSEVRTQL